jgi:tetratricopeptide (TPR) repeat protein
MMPVPKTILMILNRWRSAALAGGLAASACATTSPLVRQQCYDADLQLASVLQPLESLRAQGCHAPEQGSASDCDRLRIELERLTVICPAHAPTLMANAILAYDEHRPEKSQRFLDQILAQSRNYPDATVLRARIALEEGDVPFARRLIEQQLRLAPDHAELHETYGAVLYLGGALPEATRELTTAGALGAPRWRIAYHLGLVEEASGRLDEARRYYSEAVQANPGWALAESRLKALTAQGDQQRR